MPCFVQTKHGKFPSFMDFNNKTALITGASRGIGKAIA